MIDQTLIFTSLHVLTFRPRYSVQVCTGLQVCNSFLTYHFVLRLTPLLLLHVLVYVVRSTGQLSEQKKGKKGGPTV